MWKARVKLWSYIKFHRIRYTNVQDLAETHQSTHLLVCWCAAFDSMICLSMSCKSCKAAVNAMTQGFVPFVDSAELACGALTAQRGAIFFRSNRVKSTSLHSCESTSGVYSLWRCLLLERTEACKSNKVSDKPVRKLLMGSHSVNALWARAVQTEAVEDSILLRSAGWNHGQSEIWMPADTHWSWRVPS